MHEDFSEVSEKRLLPGSESRQGIIYSFQPFTLVQFKPIASEKGFDIIAQAL